MVTSLQTFTTSLPVGGGLGKNQLIDPETGQPIFFGEILKFKEKQLQQEQLVNAATVTAALMTLQAQSFISPVIFTNIPFDTSFVDGMFQPSKSNADSIKDGTQRLPPTDLPVSTSQTSSKILTFASSTEATTTSQPEPFEPESDLETTPSPPKKIDHDSAPVQPSTNPKKIDAVIAPVEVEELNTKEIPVSVKGLEVEKAKVVVPQHKLITSNLKVSQETLSARPVEEEKSPQTINAPQKPAGGPSRQITGFNPGVENDALPSSSQPEESSAAPVSLPTRQPGNLHAPDVLVETEDFKGAQLPEIDISNMEVPVVDHEVSTFVMTSLPHELEVETNDLPVRTVPQQGKLAEIPIPYEEETVQPRINGEKKDHFVHTQKTISPKQPGSEKSVWVTDVLPGIETSTPEKASIVESVSVHAAKVTRLIQPETLQDVSFGNAEYASTEIATSSVSFPANVASSIYDASAEDIQINAHGPVVESGMADIQSSQSHLFQQLETDPDFLQKLQVDPEPLKAFISKSSLTSSKDSKINETKRPPSPLKDQMEAVDPKNTETIQPAHHDPIPASRMETTNLAQTDIEDRVGTANIFPEFPNRLDGKSFRQTKNESASRLEGSTSIQGSDATQTAADVATGKSTDGLLSDPGEPQKTAATVELTDNEFPVATNTDAPEGDPVKPQEKVAVVELIDTEIPVGTKADVQVKNSESKVHDFGRVIPHVQNGHDSDNSEVSAQLENELPATPVEIENRTVSARDGKYQVGVPQSAPSAHADMEEGVDNKVNAVTFRSANQTETTARPSYPDRGVQTDVDRNINSVEIAIVAEKGDVFVLPNEVGEIEVPDRMQRPAKQENTASLQKHIKVPDSVKLESEVVEEATTKRKFNIDLSTTFARSVSYPGYVENKPDLEPSDIVSTTGSTANAEVEEFAHSQEINIIIEHKTIALNQITTKDKPNAEQATFLERNDAIHQAEPKPQTNQMPGFVEPASSLRKEAVNVPGGGTVGSGQIHIQAVEIVQQVIRQMNGRIKSGPSAMHLQLNPKELGAIDVEIVSGSQGMHVTFYAEQASTGKLLETGMTQLRDSLIETGVQLAGLNISQHNQSNQRGGGFTQGQNFIHHPEHEFVQSKTSKEEAVHVERVIGQTSEVDYRI